MTISNILNSSVQQSFSIEKYKKDPAYKNQIIESLKQVSNTHLVFEKYQNVPNKKILYCPLTEGDIVEQCIGQNIIRYRSNKPLLPVLVSNVETKINFNIRLFEQLIDNWDRTNTFFSAINNLRETMKTEGDWYPGKERELLSPEKYDASLDAAKVFAEEFSVISQMEVISNADEKILSKLSPEKDRLYIVGHGGAGIDFLAADQQLKNGVVTSVDLAKQLKDGGLEPDFRDIRVTACYSADNKKPKSFENKELEKRSGKKTKSFLSSLKQKVEKAIPYSQGLSDALGQLGFNNIVVTGYHGAGVTYSNQDQYLRRIPENKEIADVPRSSVKSKFVPRNKLEKL